MFLIYTVVIDFIRDLINKKFILSKYIPYLIHSGIVITVIGITGSSAYKVKKDVALKEGEKTEIDGFVLNYRGVKFLENSSYDAARAEVEVIIDGKTIGLLHPEMRFYRNWEEPSAEMDVLPGIKGDLYAVVKGFDRDGTTYFEFHSNPLIHLVWNGIIFVLIGGILTLIRRQK
jgi:cytochrome c-type biogenesis protein CcmF